MPTHPGQSTVGLLLENRPRGSGMQIILGLILQDGLPDCLNFWNVALEVKDLAEDDFENLLDVYAVRRRAEDQRDLHRLCVSSCLLRNLSLGNQKKPR